MQVPLDGMNTEYQNSKQKILWSQSVSGEIPEGPSLVHSSQRNSDWLGRAKGRSSRHKAYFSRRRHIHKCSSRWKHSGWCKSQRLDCHACSRKQNRLAQAMDWNAAALLLLRHDFSQSVSASLLSAGHTTSNLSLVCPANVSEKGLRLLFRNILWREAEMWRRNLTVSGQHWHKNKGA